MIHLVNLTKTYNEKKPNENMVLKGISLTIHHGDFIALIGRSGSGKSTLLHILALLDKASSGEYLFNNENVASFNDSKQSKFRNSKIGILLQDFQLIEHESAIANVMTPLYFNDSPLRKMKGKALEAMKKVGIEQVRKQNVYTLSGGEKQRVGLARAIVNNPDILLADEPTGSLDSNNSKIIMDLMVKLNEEGKTIIVVTHDINIANRCKRKVEIDDGRIIM